MSHYIELFFNPIILFITLVALFAYTVLIDLIVFSFKTKDIFLERFKYWKKAIGIMIASLPLLGLLGTVVGLIETFVALSANRSLDLQSLMSAGIADAMFSTQYGLSLAIPGYVLIHVLRSKRKRALLTRR